MLRQLYLGPLGRCLSAILNVLAAAHRPFMVYGYRDSGSRKFRKFTRISSTAALLERRNLSIGDHVWIWHHSIIDGSCGVTIGTGVQIGAWVGVFSHGSQVSIRLHGADYIRIDKSERTGYTRAPVVIEDYCFVGAGALVLPGTRVGRGCLIAANAVVSGDIPPFSIVKGNPGQVVGDTRRMDARFLAEGRVAETYFDREAMADWLANQQKRHG